MKKERDSFNIQISPQTLEQIQFVFGLIKMNELQYDFFSFHNYPSIAIHLRINDTLLTTTTADRL